MFIDVLVVAIKAGGDITNYSKQTVVLNAVAVYYIL